MRIGIIIFALVLVLILEMAGFWLLDRKES